MEGILWKAWNPAASRAGQSCVPLLLCLSRCDYRDDDENDIDADDNVVLVMPWCLGIFLLMSGERLGCNDGGDAIGKDARDTEALYGGDGIDKDARDTRHFVTVNAGADGHIFSGLQQAAG